MPASARLTEVTEASIGALVGRFYAAIRRDPGLGLVFEAAIGDADWPRHLATLRRFWSSVMLGSGHYSGNPVAVHRTVAGLERPMFAPWLALFEATAASLFVPETAALFAGKARRIAASLQIAVFHRPGAGPDLAPSDTGPCG